LLLPLNSVYGCAVKVMVALDHDSAAPSNEKSDL